MSLGVGAVKSLVGWEWPEATKGVLALDVLFVVALIPLYRAGRLGLADLGIRQTPRKLGVGLLLLGLAPSERLPYACCCALITCVIALISARWVKACG
jgi:hypothetical protein